ncbi:MAG: hypothetical protein KCHDKBKB_00749 [Elusimicrobia bacterium]|nr:hypothetical protein [Elusimicrobiota bacterium]
MKNIFVKVNSFMQKKSTQTYWVLLAVFVAGGVVNALIRPTPEPIVKTVVETKEVVSCPMESTWKELKSIDDQGFMLSSRGFNTVSVMMDAMSRFDVATAESKVMELNSIATEIQSMTAKRVEILQKLGY